MIKVKSITLERAEGPTIECVERTFTSFAEANAQLYRWSRTAPKGGGYDKVDVAIEWEDGIVYRMRYDMVRNLDDGNLTRHFESSLKFWSGRTCPPHMTPERYARFFNEFDPDGSVRAFANEALDTRERGYGAVAA